MRVRPAVGEGLCLAGEERTVRRQRNLDIGDLREHGDERRQVVAEQGLAAGEAELAYPLRREDAREPRDLL